MIIRTFGSQQHFITQPDHAHLSRRIMAHCADLQVHPRAASILLAIGEHDNGWAEADAAPTVDRTTGQPLDFVNAPADVRQGVWPRGVARLAHDSWAAALVANHAITVYDRNRSDPAWTVFFAQMEARRAALLTERGGRLDHLLADYVFVRLGDLLSLMFCTGWTEAQRFALWTVSRFGEAVVVAPDPFDGETVAVEVGARELPARRYRDDAELREALTRAATMVMRGEVRGSR